MIISRIRMRVASTLAPGQILTSAIYEVVVATLVLLDCLWFRDVVYFLSGDSSPELVVTLSNCTGALYNNESNNLRLIGDEKFV